MTKTVLGFTAFAVMVVSLWSFPAAETLAGRAEAQARAQIAAAILADNLQHMR